jgi:hypothetical protein
VSPTWPQHGVVYVPRAADREVWFVRHPEGSEDVNDFLNRLLGGRWSLEAVYTPPDLPGVLEVRVRKRGT